MRPAHLTRRVVRTGVEAGLGASAAYLLDPDHGAQRRARLAQLGRDAFRRSVAHRMAGDPFGGEAARAAARGPVAGFGTGAQPVTETLPGIVRTGQP